MTTLRSVAIWTGIILIGLLSAACWLVAIATIMLWPLPAIAILTVAAVTSLAAMHIADVRVDQVTRHLNARDAAAAAVTPPAVDPLREVLGEVLYEELSALSVSPD